MPDLNMNILLSHHYRSHKQPIMWASLPHQGGMQVCTGGTASNLDRSSSEYRTLFIQTRGLLVQLPVFVSMGFLWLLWNTHSTALHSNYQRDYQVCSGKLSYFSGSENYYLFTASNFSLLSFCVTVAGRPYWVWEAHTCQQRSRDSGSQ